MPNLRKIRGSAPTDILHEYFNQFQGEILEKEYLATQIQSYNDSIISNKNLISKMTKRFVNSFKFILLTSFLFAIIYIKIIIHCNN